MTHKDDFFDCSALKERIHQSFEDSDHACLEKIQELSDFLLSEKEYPLTGESCLNHAYGVAAIMSDLGFGKEPVYASLLFLSVLTDENPNGFLEEKLNHHFIDNDTRSLIRGVVRVFHIQLFRYDDLHQFDNQRIHVESFRQMILALVEDIRVVVLVLASHVQTLRYLTTIPLNDFHTHFSQTILHVFAPLANRLGVWQLKWELEDLSFRFYKPDIYQSIAKKIREKRNAREFFIESCIKILESHLDKEGMSYKIYGRPKHIYSIFNKMSCKDLDFSDLYDIHAIRILVPSVRFCYVVLGIVHSLWIPLPRQFDDYILQPKSNLYQSLHTVVQVNPERNLEIQIRTFDMHKHAELGVAAHWRYKEKDKKNCSYDEKISLLRRLLIWRDDLSQKPMWASETQRIALNQTIYVFTPQGKVMALPSGSTPIDFSYALHTEIGHRCRGAKVDQMMVSLDTPLQTGQTVEILTVNQGGPSRDWLGHSPVYAVSHRARSKIRQHFYQLDSHQDLSLVKGKEMVSRKLFQLKRDDLSPEAAASIMGFSEAASFYRAVYNGEVAAKMWRLFLPQEQQELVIEKELSDQKNDYSSYFSVMGVSGLVTRLAHCCHPIPSDAVVGFVTKDHCISVHRVDCINWQRLKQKSPERVIEVNNVGVGPSLLQWSYCFKIELLHSDSVLKEIVDLFSRVPGSLLKFLSHVHRDILIVHVVWKTTPPRYHELMLCLKKIRGFIRLYRV